MDAKQRLQTAWEFREPDRVPIEFSVYGPLRQMPEAASLLKFESEEADNFHHVPGFDWGFCGLDTQYHEETIEEVPGQYKRIKHIQQTPVGEFHAITRHYADEFDPNDFHWERRYIHSFDDFVRLAEAERSIRPFDIDAYNRGCREIGTRGIPVTGLWHPLGVTVRKCNLEEVYSWLLTERDTVIQFLENANRQVADSIIAGIQGKEVVDPPVFKSYALEMLIPPWLGMNHFTDLVFPYDQRVNQAIHSVSGKHRAHCHGNSGSFLKAFADMGIDSVEPLEPPPFGDNILSRAKQAVGTRMLLSGNIPSQNFPNMTCDEVEESVRRAVQTAASGGGFTLKMTGSAIGVCKNRNQALDDIEKGKAFIHAALKYGKY